MTALVGPQQAMIDTVKVCLNQSLHPPPLKVRCIELHTGRVNELSFDKQEEHIASCSDDCSVVVRLRKLEIRGGNDENGTRVMP
jgi:hypothetical protein